MTGKKGGIFSDSAIKNQRLNLIVVRVNKSGSACNARPCYNCLNLMKVVGIRKIFYTVSEGEVICESVKNMVSIQSSSVSKYIEKLNGNLLVDTPEQYYEDLLLKYFPKQIKKKNLYNFINYNLINVLPNYSVVEKNHTVYIFNSNKHIILTSEIIN